MISYFANSKPLSMSQCDICFCEVVARRRAICYAFGTCGCPGHDVTFHFGQCNQCTMIIFASDCITFSVFVYINLLTHETWELVNADSVSDHASMLLPIYITYVVWLLALQVLSEVFITTLVSLYVQGDGLVTDR